MDSSLHTAELMTTVSQPKIVGRPRRHAFGFRRPRRGLSCYLAIERWKGWSKDSAWGDECSFTSIVHHTYVIVHISFTRIRIKFATLDHFCQAVVGFSRTAWFFLGWRCGLEDWSRPKDVERDDANICKPSGWRP